MATWSSSALGTDNKYINFKIYITENSTSITGNTSNVTVKVSCYRTNTGYTTYGSGTVYCTINGTTYSESITASDKITSGGIWLFSKTLNIPHHADGTETLTVSASIDHSRFQGSTQSFSHALTTIPRKSSLTAGNGTLGTAQTISISRASGSFTHTITYKCGGASGTITTKTTATSVSWTPPLSLASQNTKGTSVSVTLTLTTYNGSTSLGSVTKTISAAIPAHVKPACSVTVSDGTANYATYGGYIKTKSTLKIVVTASGHSGSTIKSYRVVANGTTYDSASFTTGALKSAGAQTISVTVTDTRGRTATTSKSITVLDYSPPGISLLSVSRCNADGTANDQGEYGRVTISASAASLSKKNAVTYAFCYKKRSETSYSSDIAITGFPDPYHIENYSNAKCIFKADSGSTYDVILKAKDKLSGEVQSKTYLSTATTIMHIGKEGRSVAFGKTSERIDAVESAWPIYSTNMDLGFCQSRPDTEYIIYFGIGSGGENRGIFDGTDEHWMLWRNKNGNTALYGDDVYIQSKRSNASFVPYYRKGDKITISTTLDTAGYITNSGTYVMFCYPLAKPTLGVSSVSCASIQGLMVRQEGKYLYGGTASAYVKPASYTCWLINNNCLSIRAAMGNSTNVLNNAPCGIVISATLTFN